MSGKLPAHLLLLCAIAFTVAASSAQAQTITMPTFGDVGSGLQGSTYNAFLSTSQHGGTTVHIESDNPSVVLVAPNATTSGAASYDVFVPNGSTGVGIVISGVENATGTATITVSAPGFTSGTRQATIVQPAVDMVNLSTSIDTLDPADPFYVRVGLPGTGNSNVSQSQNVRTGGTGLTATIVNSNATAGQLITTPVTGQTVTVSIAPGSFFSPSSVVSGGVAFDGLNASSTTVSASIPGFIITTAASVNVSVTDPTISVGTITNVGSGLQGSPVWVSLSASEHGGVTVHIESANPSIALVAPNGGTAGSAAIDVVILNGQTGTSFVVSGLEGVTGVSNITISAPGFIGTSQPANIQQAALDLLGLMTSLDTLDPADVFQIRVGLPSGGITSVNPTQVVRVGGVALTATIKLSAGAIGDLVTTPLTGDSVVVTIPVGLSSSASSLAAGGVAFDGVALGSTTVSATIPNLISTTNANQTVTVTKPAIGMSAIAVVGSGLVGGTNSATLGASQHGGVTVHVESSNPSAALVAPNSTTVGTASFDVVLANGSTAVSFYVSGLEGVTGTSSITVSAPGFIAASGTASIVQPGLDVVGLVSTLDTLAPVDPFQIRVGVPVSGNAGLNVPQNIRAGGTPLTATIKIANKPIGDLITTPLTGDSVVVTIATGTAISPTAVAAGGVAFDGIALGSTQVSATIPGLIATTAATRTVNVTQPDISLGLITDVGSGLQGSGNTGILSVSNHGGVTVHVESDNPSVALLSPNASTVGAASFDTLVPNGTTTVAYYVHGVENVTGTSNITLSAPGFISAMQSVDIVQPALDISGLASTFDISDANDPFQVRVGIPDFGNSSVSFTQFVRAGSPGLVATLILSNGTAGQLVTTPATNDTVTVSIGAGSSASGATVAAGGVAFDPLAVGTTLVSAAIPGFIATGSAVRSLVVSARIVTMASIDNVGTGLQTGPITATLGLAQHGGVTVHVASSDSLIALVSPNFTTPGTPFIDLPLANGSTQVSFFVQGVGAGTSTVTASVPTFTSANRSANVVQPALQVALLADSLLDNDPNDPFVVRVGVPDAGNASIATVQSVRAGGTALTASVEIPNLSFASLVTDVANGDSVTVTIPVGANQSAGTALLGGVEFDPSIPGSVTVSATIPGFIATTAASKLVVVKPHLPPTGVAGSPLSFVLAQNIPNPFNPITTIAFDVPGGGADVNVSVYDVAGRLVRELVRDHRSPGHWTVIWNGDDEHGARVSSGVYFYRMRAGSFVDTKKMVLLK